MKTLDHADYRVWLQFCDQPHYTEREKKPSEFLRTFFAYANSGNRTWAASAASECAIHYSIASQRTAPSCRVEHLLGPCRSAEYSIISPPTIKPKRSLVVVRTSFSGPKTSRRRKTIINFSKFHLNVVASNYKCRNESPNQKRFQGNNFLLG